MLLFRLLYAHVAGYHGHLLKIPLCKPKK